MDMVTIHFDLKLYKCQECGYYNQKVREWQLF